MADGYGIVSQTYLPKVKTGHVVPEIGLQRIEDRLSRVRGSLVECPLVRCCSLARCYFKILIHFC